MTNRSLFVLLCMGALIACGGDDEPSECATASCQALPQPVEAGASVADASTSSPAPSGQDAGSPAANNPGNNVPGNNTPTDAGSAPKPPADAGTTPRADGGTAEPIPTPGGPAKPSAGCGKPAPMVGTRSIDINGTARSYILTLPMGYDPMKPYKLIFAWHGLGGTADSIMRGGYYGLQSRAKNTVIFVTGQGLATSGTASGAGAGGAGWANTNGQDVNFVKALYKQLQGELCFDEDRVFSTGMSYGGIMSNTLGCSMGDVFRAVAPMSGQGPGFGGRATCVGQVAWWSSHGDDDAVVATANGETSRDFWVKANHCQTTSKPVEPSPCVAYDGCDMGYPVTFCKFAGGHIPAPFAYAAIWDFFSQF